MALTKLWSSPKIRWSEYRCWGNGHTKTLMPLSHLNPSHPPIANSVFAANRIVSLLPSKTEASGLRRPAKKYKGMFDYTHFPNWLVISHCIHNATSHTLTSANPSTSAPLIQVYHDLLLYSWCTHGPQDIFNSSYNCVPLFRLLSCPSFGALSNAPPTCIH